MLLFLAAAMALPASGRPQGWFVEGALGFSLLDPGDLNARPEGQQALTDFTYRAGYEALQRTAGGTFTYSLAQAEGSGLEGIHGGFPDRPAPRPRARAARRGLRRAAIPRAAPDIDAAAGLPRPGQAARPGDPGRLPGRDRLPRLFPGGERLDPPAGGDGRPGAQKELDGRRAPGRRPHVRGAAHHRSAAYPENGGGRLLDGIALCLST